MTTNANNNNVYLISYRTLRRLIGILGIGLPFLCWGVNAFVNHLDLLNNPHFVDKSQTQTYIAGADLKASISHFYYTTAGPIFTGILITVAIFLYCYKGYPKNKKDDRLPWLTDKRITVFAASCALGIVVFPTDSPQRITDNIHIFVSSRMAGNLHLSFATLFFLSMAVMSMVNFRRHPGKELISDAEGKLYLICGMGIVACILALGIYAFASYGRTWLWGEFVYIMEVIMLIFFGTAWLVKGKSIPTEFILDKINS
jgi:hypothetical protein